MGEWISVKDRLPERFCPVLVCREKEKGQYVVVQGYKDVGDWWKVYGTRTKYVTHWMPLPAPPEDESEYAPPKTNADRIRAMSDEVSTDHEGGASYSLNFISMIFAAMENGGMTMPEVRPIDANRLLAFERFDREVTGEEHTAEDILMMIQTSPTITLESLVAHGKWEEIEDSDGDSHWKCSACGCEWYFEDGGPSENGSNYCPNCGTKMDL